MSSRSTLLSLLLIAVMGFAAFTAFLPTHPPLPLLVTPTSLPDAYMEEVKALIMDKEGKLNMKIEAPRLVHFNKDDTTDLTTPLITLYRDSTKPWVITAKHALATKGVENVTFQKDVVIHHDTDVTIPDTTIKTTFLLMHPNAKTAETHELITLLQPNLTVKSKGLFANMNSGDIKLLSQPRGEYVPNS